MKYDVDEYGVKIQVSDETRVVKANKPKTILELFGEDCAARKAQATDVVPAGEKERSDLVTDANDNLSSFLSAQEKDNNTSQDAAVLFDLSSDANTNDGSFVSEQNATGDDVKDTQVKSGDGRDEFVAETAPDNLAGFESAQKSVAKKNDKEDDKKDKAEKDKAKKDKAKKDDKKNAALVKRVKSRWASTISSILFDPFRLAQKAKKVSFKIGSDFVLMPSAKPTRSEWKTAKKVIAELRDPSIIRKAQLMDMEDEMPMDIVEEIDAPIVDGDAVIEETVTEEVEEKAKLEDALVAIEDGDVDAAKVIIEECVEMKEEEIEEATEGDENSDVDEDDDIDSIDEELVADDEIIA